MNTKELLIACSDVLLVILRQSKVNVIDLGVIAETRNKIMAHVDNMPVQEKSFLGPSHEDSVEYIICAAIWVKSLPAMVHTCINTPQGAVIAGRRHCNCISTIQALMGKRLPELDNHVQGFITSKNRFLDRYEAMVVAVACGQVQASTVGHHLFSEDLY